MGYGGIWNQYHEGRLMEFHTLPEARSSAENMFRELLDSSQANAIEAQTNMPLMLAALMDNAKNIREEAILFEDQFNTDLVCPGAAFRRATSKDAGTIFPHQHEPVGDWVIERDGAVVATGGYLTHRSNPPYADLFFEVVGHARRQGIGSFLVQELKRLCNKEGLKPTARCDPSNEASLKMLEKAGLAPVASLMVGEVASLSVAR